MSTAGLLDGCMCIKAQWCKGPALGTITTCSTSLPASQMPGPTQPPCSFSPSSQLLVLMLCVLTQAFTREELGYSSGGAPDGSTG